MVTYQKFLLFIHESTTDTKNSVQKNNIYEVKIINAIKFVRFLKIFCLKENVSGLQRTTACTVCCGLWQHDTISSSRELDTK